MNLKKMLIGNTEQLLTAKDYRIASQMRVHAGKMLMGLTPLVAIGALINEPALMIPAFYLPAALLLPPINFLLLKSVPTGKPSFMNLFKAKNWLLNPVVGLLSALALFLMYKVGIFGNHFNHNYYARHHGLLGHELRFQAAHPWTLIVAGLAMTGVCAWLSWTLMKGRRTQSMQRIAQHLAIQEAENA